MDIDQRNGDVSLVVVQDLSCAWCFIGWRELQVAIHKAEANGLPLNFQVEFKPFRLDPTLSATSSVKLADHYEGKLGPERFELVKRTLAHRGENLGIDINWDGALRRNGNCHRILRYAYETQHRNGAPSLDDDVQTHLLNEIFTGFFERAEDVGDPRTLARYCETVGLMPQDKALAFLNSPALTAEVEDMMDDAVKQGITGVPFTVINSKWAVQGGQSADVFYGIFEKLAAACHNSPGSY